jgi:hypothetical protein
MYNNLRIILDHLASPNTVQTSGLATEACSANICSTLNNSRVGRRTIKSYHNHVCVCQFYLTSYLYCLLAAVLRCLSSHRSICTLFCRNACVVPCLCPLPLLMAMLLPRYYPRRDDHSTSAVASTSSLVVLREFPPVSRPPVPPLMIASRQLSLGRSSLSSTQTFLNPAHRGADVAGTTPVSILSAQPCRCGGYRFERARSLNLT